ncbi:MAG: hypothetical protein WBV82_15370, partial [Myxococcaceae bacterium]
VLVVHAADLHSPVLVSHSNPLGQSVLLPHFVTHTSKASEQIADEPSTSPLAHSASVVHLQIMLVSVALIASHVFAESGQSADDVHVCTQTWACG